MSLRQLLADPTSETASNETLQANCEQMNGHNGPLSPKFTVLSRMQQQNQTFQQNQAIAHSSSAFTQLGSAFSPQTMSTGHLSCPSMALFESGTHLYPPIAPGMPHPTPLYQHSHVYPLQTNGHIHHSDGGSIPFGLHSSQHWAAESHPTGQSGAKSSTAEIFSSTFAVLEEDSCPLPPTAVQPLLTQPSVISHPMAHVSMPPTSKPTMPVAPLHMSKPIDLHPQGLEPGGECSTPRRTSHCESTFKTAKVDPDALNEPFCETSQPGTTNDGGGDGDSMRANNTPSATAVIQPPIAGDAPSHVCPHCNRFISQYKGNMRRHMNQCRKAQHDSQPTGESSNECKSEACFPPTSTTPVTSTPSIQASQASCHYSGKNNSASSNTSSGDSSLSSYIHKSGEDGDGGFYAGNCGFEPSMRVKQIMIRTPSTDDAPNPFVHQTDMGDDMGAGFLKGRSGQPLGKSHQTPTPKDDPYICAWCSFTTIYKGNMKRHLISCHAVNDEMIRHYSFDVESLRKGAKYPATVQSLPLAILSAEDLKEKGKGKRGQKSKSKDRNDGKDEAGDTESVPVRKKPKSSEVGKGGGRKGRPPKKAPNKVDVNGEAPTEPSEPNPFATSAPKPQAAQYMTHNESTAMNLAIGGVGQLFGQHSLHYHQMHAYQPASAINHIPHPHPQFISHQAAFPGGYHHLYQPSALAYPHGHLGHVGPPPCGSGMALNLVGGGNGLSQHAPTSSSMEGNGAGNESGMSSTSMTSSSASSSQSLSHYASMLEQGLLL